jgi:hypothetical protein
VAVLNSARKLDSLATRELTRERERHAAAVADLSVDCTDDVVAEVNRHLDRVSDIMIAFMARQSDGNDVPGGTHARPMGLGRVDHRRAGR